MRQDNLILSSCCLDWLDPATKMDHVRGNTLLRPATRTSAVWKLDMGVDTELNYT